MVVSVYVWVGDIHFSEYPFCDDYEAFRGDEPAERGGAAAIE